MRILTIVGSIVIILHGIIHLIGTAAYLKLVEIKELPYKTTLLGGRWDLREKGMAIYGVLWAVAAVGFILSAVAIIVGWSWWQPALLGVTFFSLVLTSLDWEDAKAGFITNIIILIVIWIGPKIADWFPQ
jgi:hypothetical protein